MTSLFNYRMPRIVYCRHYNIGFYGLEKLHPFDSRKYGRAWKVIRRHFGPSISKMHIRPRRAASHQELTLVHSDEYLGRLRNSGYVSAALEVPTLQRLPSWAIDWHVLRPMRWATRGTILAAIQALDHGFAANLSGGYHHAKPNQGEGFSIYADAGVAVAALRQQKRIPEESRIVYIDTDAHQGNGVCHTFMTDPRVFILDIFNGEIYPLFDLKARNRIDDCLAISSSTTSLEYLQILQQRLPGFLDSVGRSPIGLAIYNAGTDVVQGDPLGNLNVSGEAIRERDLFVVNALRERDIPTVMLLSGGYTQQSYRLVADSVIAICENEISRSGLHNN